MQHVSLVTSGAALAKQAQLLEWAWLWYEGPFALGFALILCGEFGPGRAPWTIVATIQLVAVVPVHTGVAWVNRVAARSLKEQADALPSLSSS